MDRFPLSVWRSPTVQGAVKSQELLDVKNFTDCMTASNDAVKCDVWRHALGQVVHTPEHENTWKNTVKMSPGYLTSVVVAFKLVDTGMPYPFDATADPWIAKTML